MASPAPSSSPYPRPNSSQLNYFIICAVAVALLLLLYNAIAVGWCAQHCPLWWRRRVVRNRREAAQNSQIAGLIPAYKYRKEVQGKGSDESQCAVCLSAFAEGEDVRRLPKCGHSFHAACIDMWLFSHASCPLCRASVVAGPQPSSIASADVEEDPAGVHALVLSSSAPNRALVMALV